MPITPFTVFPQAGTEWQKFLQNCIVTADTARECTVAELATLPRWIKLAIVTDETGGEVLAFKDSAGAWRRSTDRAVCSE